MLKRLANVSSPSHLLKVFCRSVLKSGVRDQKRNGGTVRNVFPLEIGGFSLLFFIPGKVKDLFEG